MSKVSFTFEGRLTTFHASAGGGLILMMGGDGVDGEKAAEAMQTIAAGMWASVSIEMDVPETETEATS